MPPNPTRIVELASIFQDSALLFAASDLGIFAALSQLGEATAAALAAKLGLNERAARLILDGAVAVGLLDKEEDRYRNTGESEMFLVPGHKADLSNAIRYMRDVYPAWGRLAAFGKTGEPVESPGLHLGDDEARTRAFVLSMHGKALATAHPVLARLALEKAKHILDVGGGPGTYSVLLSRAYPALHATVLDLPPVIRIASELIEQQGAGDRVRTLAGDYHTTPFPGGNDAVLFFGMMHQESPEGIEKLLSKAYGSLNPGGMVYVMDMMTGATHTEPKFSALFAVNMALTAISGWVFSSAELTGWLQGAGFSGVAVQPLPAPIPHWLASARKPRWTSTRRGQPTERTS
jgi:ubiquinone/menaquinone biosynthesis C-methylase UbiE